MAEGSATAVLLPGEPGSGRLARRFVADALAGTVLVDLVDTATLLVSELVTNAVLHAGSEIRVSCRIRRGVLRVEVRDRARALPAVRSYDGVATTGRGLAMVELLATGWGTEVLRDGGKAVWFELGEEAAPPGAPADAAAVGSAAPVDPAPPVDAAPGPTRAPGVEVRLLGAPVGLVLAALQHGDALLREVALLAIAPEVAPDDALADWHVPTLDTAPLRAALADAERRGSPTADLHVTFPVGSGAAALDRLARVDEAERLAVEGHLLAIPAVPEVGACRRWMLGQVVVQEGGGEPLPWVLPAPSEPVQGAARLDIDDAERLAALATAAIIADDGNRILAVNAAAGDLLGWPRDELVGRRLVTIVPHELREQHLAGFTRHLVTGENRILGRTVRLPALRRDGTTVEVEATIETVDMGGGRRAFRALLR